MLSVKAFRHFSLLIFAGVSVSSAQVNPRDSVISTPMVSISYAHQWPGGDLVNRFGSNHNMGVHYFHKTKQNWFWGAEWNLLFSSNIKESGILDSLRTENGNILDQNGEYSIIRLFQRGQHLNLRVGRVFSFGWPNNNSGLLVSAAGGYLFHKIKIDDIGKRTPNLNPDYKKGYDRLTAGPSATGTLGFVFLSNNRLANFFLLIDFTCAFTSSQRSFQFDLGKSDFSIRRDILFGPRFGVILPLYKKMPNEFYYN